MQEKLAKKLAKILAKAGLEEDEINKFVEEIDEAIAEEDPTQDDVNPDENPNPTEENGDVPPSEEGAGDNPNPGDDLPIPPAPEGDVLPEGDPLPPNPDQVDGSIDAALEELAAQEQPGDQLPPAPGEVPPTPTPDAPIIDPAEFVDLKNQLGEANKTIESLKTQIDSLYEALREAGVITGEPRVGEENPHITPSANTDQVDAFDEVLGAINNH